MTKEIRKNIVECLKFGKENATTTPELMHACGFNSRSAFKAAIKKEREKGAPILARFDGVGGYYLPRDQAELSREIYAQIIKNSKSNGIYRDLLRNAQIDGQSALNNNYLTPVAEHGQK